MNCAGQSIGRSRIGHPWLKVLFIYLIFFVCLQKVKIGNDGTVTVLSHCWKTAKASTTPNGMARVLLMGLFSVDILLKSNLKGGVSKLDPCADRRKALDPRKLQALLGK